MISSLGFPVAFVRSDSRVAEGRNAGPQFAGQQKEKETLHLDPQAVY